MVLLGMPRGVDIVWARRLAVRRHHNAHGGWPASEGVPGGLLRLQAQLVGVGGHHCCGFQHALRSIVRLRHHEAQLPEKMMLVFWNIDRSMTYVRLVDPMQIPVLCR